MSRERIFLFPVDRRRLQWRENCLWRGDAHVKFLCYNTDPRPPGFLANPLRVDESKQPLSSSFEVLTVGETSEGEIRNWHLPVSNNMPEPKSHQKFSPLRPRQVRADSDLDGAANPTTLFTPSNSRHFSKNLTFVSKLLFSCICCCYYYYCCGPREILVISILNIFYCLEFF